VRALATVTGGVACIVMLVDDGAAADKVTFLTSWYAQAEHGGF